MNEPEQAQPWGEIALLCKTMHKLLYVLRDTVRARELLPELDRLLAFVVDHTDAIVGFEARAISHELHGRFEEALRNRTIEEEQTLQLYEDVRVHQYSESTTNYMLQGRREDDMQLRSSIMRTLRQRIAGSHDESTK